MRVKVAVSVCVWFSVGIGCYKALFSYGDSIWEKELFFMFFYCERDVWIDRSKDVVKKYSLRFFDDRNDGLPT